MKSNLTDCTIALVGPIETNEFLNILDLPAGMTYPKGLGGSPVNLLALELHKRGYNLLLCSVDPSVENEVVLQGERLKIRFGNYRKRPARDFFSQESKWMAKVLIEEKPGIVHAHWTYEFALAAAASGLPHLITAHDAPLNVLKLNFIPYRIARTLMAFVAVWKAKHLSAVSPYVAEHLKKFYFYKKPIFIIPNGMPDKSFNRIKPEKNAEAPLTFATILVGWSGYKNGEAAIQAFSIAKQRLPNSRLLMFGAGHGIGEEAEQWSKNQGIDDGIEFVGHLPYADLIDRLNKDVDILVHPSLEESLSMSAIESMSMGIAVIAGKFSGALPWTLDNGRSGVLVDVANPAEIADAMYELATNNNKRKEIEQAGLIRAKEKFHISVVADAYLDAYCKILSETAS